MHRKARKLFDMAMAIAAAFHEAYGDQCCEEGGARGSVTPKGFKEPVAGYCELDPESKLPLYISIRSWSRMFGSSVNFELDTIEDETTMVLTSTSGRMGQFSGLAACPLVTEETAIFTPYDVGYRAQKYRQPSQIAS